MAVSLLTLGGVRCLVDGAELSELPAQRLRCAVLVYLSVERDTQREVLASLLWPERDSERGRHALNQKLYELRQALGEDWIQSQGERLRTAAALEVDVHHFEAAIARGDREAALSLYRGEFLAGFYLREAAEYEHWIDRHRARIARLHRTARREVIDQWAGRGDLARAITEARRWVELDPGEDDAQHRLIELLAATGDRSEAIRQYESYERKLRADDLEPMERTRLLLDRARAGVAGAATAPAQEVPPGLDGAPPRSRPVPARRLLPTALALAGLLGVGLWMALGPPGEAATPERSIAVLPFLNFSSDPAASEHLGDGIAEDLITALSQTESLHVAARTSSFRFRDRDVSISTIGDSLRVALVLEGSVRREGERLRVTAQLIKTSDGYHVWSQTFDRKLDDVLAVQREIADAVANALRIQFADRGPVGQGGTSNQLAYDLFLRGRHLVHKATRAAALSAIGLLDSALALDPDYALAHAQRAEAYTLAATRDLPRALALDSARRAAERATRIAPALADGHAALARVYLERWDWLDAEQEARRAVELDRRNAAAHATYAQVLLARGRREEALREAALAADLEPLSAAIADNYAEALRASRNFERAAQLHRLALELEPALGRQSLAKTFVDLRMYDSARAQFRGAVAAGAPRVNTIPWLWNAYVAARAGDAATARAALHEFEGRQPRGPGAYLLAATYVALGDRDRVFAILHQATLGRDQAAWRQLPWDPAWDPVRDDPRFRRILESMGLQRSLQQ